MEFFKAQRRGCLNEFFSWLFQGSSLEGKSSSFYRMFIQVRKSFKIFKQISDLFVDTS